VKLLRSLTVNFSKLPTCHWEIRILFNYLACCLIRHENTSENVFFIVVVICWTYKWINFELFFFFNSIKDEVRAVKHEVRHLVPLTPKACLYELQNQPSESRTRSQYFVSFFEVIFSFLHQLFIIVYLLTFIWPLTVELFYSCFNFREIAVRDWTGIDRLQSFLSFEMEW